MPLTDEKNSVAASCEFSLWGEGDVSLLAAHQECTLHGQYIQHYTLVYATVHIGNVDCCVSIQCGALQQLVVSWKGGRLTVFDIS